MGPQWSIEWICEVSGAKEAEYLPAETQVTVEESGRPVPVEARHIIRVGGYVVVELRDEPGEWYMGHERADGTISCWGSYGDLETTLRSL